MGLMVWCWLGVVGVGCLVLVVPRSGDLLGFVLVLNISVMVSWVFCVLNISPRILFLLWFIMVSGCCCGWFWEVWFWFH